jgi:hypothetical protein
MDDFCHHYSDRELLERIYHRQGDIMTALDNAVAAIQTAATAVETAVTDLVAALAADNPTDVATAVTNLQSIAAALTTAAAADPGPQPAPAVALTPDQVAARRSAGLPVD